jgi:tetratricopeptide (TPR) repeat protein
MNNQFLFKLIYALLCLFIFTGCSKDDPKKEQINIYLHDASIAYQNGDFDKAIKYYKLFLDSNNNEDEALLEFVNLQLARISFSKGDYDEAMNYADKVKNSDLFFKANLFKEETIFNHSMKGLITDEETDKINSFGYSLKNNALTILGYCYLKKGDYENAIRYFKDIEPESEGFYYLALACGSKGDLMNERNYYKLNSETGSAGLIETKEWLSGHSNITTP